MSPNKGREEGRKEEEGQALFAMNPNGTWEREGIVVEAVGSYSYTVLITGTNGRAWKEEDWIICTVPHVMALLRFLTFLTWGRQPLFTSNREHTPSNIVC